MSSKSLYKDELTMQIWRYTKKTWMLQLIVNIHILFKQRGEIKLPCKQISFIQSTIKIVTNYDLKNYKYSSF